MLGLTPEERKAILFLISVALIGQAVKFTSCVNPRIGKIVQVDNYFGRIDINKVSYEELLRAKSLSLKLAEKIIEYRQAHERFKSIDELKDIKGIGEYRFQKLKDLFFVE